MYFCMQNCKKLYKNIIKLYYNIIISYWWCRTFSIHCTSEIPHQAPDPTTPVDVLTLCPRLHALYATSPQKTSRTRELRRAIQQLDALKALPQMTLLDTILQTISTPLQ